MSGVDLRGAYVPITTPTGQPAEILFDFGAVNVSAYTWRGQIRETTAPTAASPTASFTFSNPTNFQVLAALSEVAVNGLSTAIRWTYEIEQLTPTKRQMFYGEFKVIQDYAR